MNSSPDSQIARSARLEDAAGWRLRIEADAAVGQSEAFLAWLSDARNMGAFDRVCATWNVFDDSLAAPEMIAIRHDTLARLRRRTLGRSISFRRSMMAVAATLAVFIGVWGMWRAAPRPVEYATDIGERRTISLEDGSRILLDSDSSVSVRYTNTVRELKLMRGRARFDVAHNIARPFTVTAGNETVVAVGTAFNVERLGPKIVVMLLEGRVVVKPAPSHPDAARALPVSMTAGQMLVANGNRPPVLTRVSLAVANAWEAGHLIFDGAPLGEVVEQVDRYTNKPLQVDPAVADLRISGAFNAGDVASFVDAITSYFPVQASTSTDDRIVLQKRS